MIAPMTATTIELTSSAPSIGLRVEQHAGEEAADEGADDAEDDVADDAVALVTLDDEAGEIAGDGAEDDPGDDAHSSYLHSPSQALHPLAGGLFPDIGVLGVTVGSRTTRPAYMRSHCA